MGQAQQQAQVTQGQGAGLEAAVPVVQAGEPELVAKATTAAQVVQAAITEVVAVVVQVQ